MSGQEEGLNIVLQAYFPGVKCYAFESVNLKRYTVLQSLSRFSHESKLTLRECSPDRAYNASSMP